MKKLVVLLVSLLAVSAWAGPKASGVRGYMAANGIDPDLLASRSDIRLFVDSDGNVLSVDWDAASVGAPAPDVAALPDEATSAAAESAFRAAKEAKRQAAKSARLKGAEKKLIQFLRDEGAIAAGAKKVTVEQIDAMYANWEATLNDTQLEKKSTKYTRLLEQVERAGGVEADAYWQE